MAKAKKNEDHGEFGTRQGERPAMVKELSPQMIKSNARMNVLRQELSNALKTAHEKCVEMEHGEMTFHEVNAALIHQLHAYNKAGLENEINHQKS